MATLLRFPAPAAGALPGPRGLWLDEALAREGDPTPRPLEGDLRVDVCVVGGGYTGLWTARELKRRSPSLSVAVLEADICGGGASGRNGGFIMTWWSKFGSLLKRCGVDAALKLARRAEAAVDAIGTFCADEGIDAGFHKAGWVWAATNAAQVGAWLDTLEALECAGARPYELLDHDTVASLTGSPVHLAGVFERNAAIAQPAVLARGLHAAVRRAGVHVHERTPVLSVEDGSALHIRTPRGSVTAERVVLAINAWSAAIPEVRPALIVVSSDVIATEPIPDRLARIGWSLDLGVSDSRRLINYYRPTDDGRVVFGKGGGTLTFGGRRVSSLTERSTRTQELRGQFRQIYPALWDAPITASWRGPIDYSVSGLPFFVRVAGRPDIVLAAGFSGNGVGPSYVAGQTLARIVLEGDDSELPEAMTEVPKGTLPPEPLRYAGGLLVRSAIARKERAEDLGHEVGPITRRLARLDPTSTIDRTAASGIRRLPSSRQPESPAFPSGTSNE